MDLIIDTDIGCDCDDAGALAVAFTLMTEGLCTIKALTHCTSRVDGCSTIDAIARYYGYYELPIGIYQPDGFLDDMTKQRYSVKIKESFPNRFHKKEQCEDAVKVLRRTLTKNEDGMIIIGIGPMPNLRDLLFSEPDESSPLNGKELLFEKCSELVLMCGCFDKQYDHMLSENSEWNIFQDISAAQTIFDCWPGKISVIPFETGVHILTGYSLLEQSETNPVGRAYTEYLPMGECARCSWDQCTVHYAITKDKTLWEASAGGKIEIDDRGVSSFRETNDGSQYVIRARSDNAAALVFEELMSRKPQTEKENVS